MTPEQAQSIAAAYASSIPNSLITKRVRFLIGENFTKSNLEEERDSFRRWVNYRLTQFGVPYSSQLVAWNLYDGAEEEQAVKKLLNDSNLKKNKKRRAKRSWEEQIIKSIKHLVKTNMCNYDENLGQC